MLKTIAAVLLAATAVAPALAQDNHQVPHHERGPRGDRSVNVRPQNGPEPGFRGGHARGMERGRPQISRVQGGRPEIRVPTPQQRAQADNRAGGSHWQANVDHNWRGRNGDRQNWNRGDHQHPGQWNGSWRGADRNDDRGHDRNDNRWNRNGDHGVQWDRAWRGDNRGDRNWNRGDRDHWNRGDRDHSRNWNRGWRNNDRYDWRDWRRGHRDIYRLRPYRSPYGWGYRRFSVGVRIAPAFFAENYWISDPWYYRLPPAYGPYRWVRYYNDALLVDIETGMVVDEIPDFFW